MKKKFKYLAMLYIMFLILPFGYGIWVISKSATGVYRYGRTNSVPVAYIAGEPNKKYTSIERALKVAGDDLNANTIYVIPRTNPTITRNTLIANGDTLIIPYEEELTGETFDPEIPNGIADGNATSVTNNRRNSIKVADGITLTVDKGGKIIIGGQAGKGGTGHTGFTSQFYTEIVMGEEAIINNNGVIDNFGYIKEYTKDNRSQINVSETGKISMPLVFYDYRGGTFSLAAVNKKVFPFTIFDLPNIQSRIIYTAGAILEGKVVIPEMTGREANRVTGNIIGGKDSDALFRIKSGSMSFKYTPNRPYTYDDDNNFTTNDARSATDSERDLNLTHVDVTGNVDFSSLEIDVGTVINSKDFFLPLSYKFRIKVKKGWTVNVQNKMKFYKGALIEIEPHGTVNLNNQTMFYQTYFEKTRTSAYFYPKYFNSTGHTARLVNNGTLIINAPFAGKVDTSIPDAIITIGDDFSSDVKTTEMVHAERYLVIFTRTTLVDIKGYAIGKISSDMEENPTESQFSKTQDRQYTSQGLWWLGPQGSTLTDEEIGGEYR